VRFAEQHCATAALEAMNGAHLDPELKGAPLIVRYAESLTQKAARRARKAARMVGRLRLLHALTRPQHAKYDTPQHHAVVSSSRPMLD
jgi:hypothetical protein